MKHTSSELQLGDVGFVQLEECPECGADPGDPHAGWCLHDELSADEDE
ncbi:MAG TPA: hypothetical protein VMN58_04915 [Acidimicrobiales bacterium]|nr:hypothetical protein [Acidimicrobiales bacterium]